MGMMRRPATPPGSGPQTKALDMSVPSHADVIVLHRRPGPSLRPGDLVPECRLLRPPGPGEVVVRNIVTSVDPYQPARSPYRMCLRRRPGGRRRWRERSAGRVTAATTVD